MSFRRCFVCLLALAPLSILASESRPSDRRTICRVFMEALGMKGGVSHGIPQPLTKNLGLIAGSDSNRAYSHLIILDPMSDETPIEVIQVFLPDEAQPDVGLEDLLRRAERNDSPQSIAKFKLGRFEMKLPTSVDENGRLNDDNLTGHSLAGLLPVVSEGDVIDLVNLNGEVAIQIRELIARKIREHFSEIDRGLASEFHRVIRNSDIDSEFEGILFEPKMIAALKSIEHDAGLHKPGEFYLSSPQLSRVIKKVRDESHICVRANLGSYLSSLLNIPEFKKELSHILDANPVVRSWLGDDFRISGNQIVYQVGTDGSLSLHFQVSLRLRSDETPDEIVKEEAIVAGN